MLERPSNARPRVHVGLGIVLHRESRAWRILITQRRANTHLAGWWEFPGGKIEPDESPAQCVARELMEEVALRVAPMRALCIVEHAYDNLDVVLHPWLCTRIAGQVQLRNIAAYQWVDPVTLINIPFPPANQSIISEIDKLYTQGGVFAHALAE